MDTTHTRESNNAFLSLSTLIRHAVRIGDAPNVATGNAQGIGGYQRECFSCVLCHMKRANRLMARVHGGKKPTRSDHFGDSHIPF
ncbi:hypothetical protein OUZ56_014231 [Daphnia magna]|uniref:Uncharacterized protein n=1 Tax=Daphnia magna TaxID=35525 RepID=A0ABQ9Z874_9CRUS|nr:hypothetical protein OUZ56_014231 [Daphnia magna]